MMGQHPFSMLGGDTDIHVHVPSSRKHSYNIIVTAMFRWSLEPIFLALVSTHVHNISNIYAVDLDENRLRVAKEMGATYTVKVTTRDSRALAKQIEDTLGCKPDRTIECSGAEPSIATAIYVSNVMASLAGYYMHGI